MCIFVGGEGGGGCSRLGFRLRVVKSHIFVNCTANAVIMMIFLSGFDEFVILFEVEL